MGIEVGRTERTAIKRVPRKTVNDSEVVRNILDSGLYGNLACVIDGQPFIMPVGYARDGDKILFHGSAASR